MKRLLYDIITEGIISYDIIYDNRYDIKFLFHMIYEIGTGTAETPRGKFRKLCCIASLKGLRLVHFFRGPLKELANVISGSPQAAARR